jgi:hypothetical protein
MPTNGLFAPGEVLTAGNTNSLLTRGYSNRIINGAFVINQRVYVSGTNLASGVYGLDRWRSGFTNTSLTFTAGSQSTTVTISASGVLQQIVERENMPAGTYTLSWTGTATGRVYNVGGTPPAYGASPQIVTLDGTANVMVEFTASGGTRTLTLVQLEGGNVFSPFQYRHRGEELAMCQRYFESSYELGTAPGTAVANNCIQSLFVSVTGTSTASGSYAVTKRVRPTMRLYSTNTGAIDRIYVIGLGDTVFGAEIGTNRIRAGVGTVTTTGIQYQFTADAEF